MKLVIRISDNSLSFSTFREDSPRTIDYEPYMVRQGIAMAANLRQALAECRLPRTASDSATVLIDTPVLLVPVEEYNHDSVSIEYKTVFTGHDSDDVIGAVLPGENAVAAFALNRDLKMVVDDHFPENTFMPLMQPVWNCLHRRSFYGLRQKLYCYFHDRKVDVASFRQNRFRFANRFNATHAQDAAYFVLYVWKQLGMDNRTDELHLVGEIPDSQKLIEILHKYVANIMRLDITGEASSTCINGLRSIPFDLQTLYTIGR